MDVELSYQDKTFEFNISPLMPIQYIRSLAFKTFKIPEQTIELNYKGNKIDKQYNDTYLKDYFPNSLKINIIVTVCEIKNPLRILLNSTRSLSTFKNNKILKTKTLKYKVNIDGTQKIKCEECHEKEVEYYCREDSKFICYECKIKHEEHKCIEIQKGNIEQCGNMYKKILIHDLRIQEGYLIEINKKSKSNHLKDIIEQLYDLISKIFHLKKDIMDFYPCIPLENLNKFDFKNTRKTIYSIDCDSTELFNYKEKKKYFKELQKEDFIIDSIKHDIESYKKKFNLEEFLINIIQIYLNNLTNLKDDLNKLWKDKRKNLFDFANELDDIIEIHKKNFNLQNYEDKLNSSFEYDENNIEKVLFENRKNKVLPRIILSRNFPVLTNFHSSSFRSRNISENKLNLLTYDMDFSSDINYNLGNGNNSYNNFSSLKKKKVYEDQRDSFFKLDRVLLNEKDLNSLSPKRPKKTYSIRLSFYKKNNLQKITPAEIMKIKKKKKKHIKNI